MLYRTVLCRLGEAISAPAKSFLRGTPYLSTTVPKSRQPSGNVRISLPNGIEPPNDAIRLPRQRCQRSHGVSGYRPSGIHSHGDSSPRLLRLVVSPIKALPLVTIFLTTTRDRTPLVCESEPLLQPQDTFLKLQYGYLTTKPASQPDLLVHLQQVYRHGDQMAPRP